MMETRDGSIVVKPVQPVELDFYTNGVFARPEFEPLRPFIPRFYGRLDAGGDGRGHESAQGPPTEERAKPVDNKDKSLSYCSIG